MPPKKRVKAKAPEPVHEPEFEEEEPLAIVARNPPPDDDDEDTGVTRCVCGMAEDDYGFMVQCDTCKCWQHGFCVGYSEAESKSQTDYYCEQCRPDLHVGLLKNLKKLQKGHVSASSSSHDPTSHKLSATTTTPSVPATVTPTVTTTTIPNNILGTSTTVSTSQSRSSRSPSPPPMKPGSSSAGHKRRNTLNSREAAFDEAVATNNLDKLIADGQEDKPRGSRKRKRPGTANPEEIANGVGKKKRSSGTPASTTSELANLMDVDTTANTNEGTSVNGSVKADNTSSRRGKRVKKEKEPSLEPEAPPPPPPVKPKQPNQYTNRAKVTAPSNTSPTKSTVGRNAPAGSVGPDPPPSQPTTTTALPASAPTSSAPRRNQGNTSRPSAAMMLAQSPPPAPLSWNLPDHLSHLADLLPTPNPQPIDVRTGSSGGADRALDKPARVKWPLKRTTIGEMRRRVRAMLDFVTKAQTDVVEREKRVKALDEARKAAVAMMVLESQEGEGVGDIDMVVGASPKPLVHDHAAEQKPPPPSTNTYLSSTSTALIPEGMTTAQLLASLTQDLINFQEKFGAGPGGKLYRDRVERERRPRGAAAAAAMDRDE